MNDLISKSALLKDIEESVVVSGRDNYCGELRGVRKVIYRIESAPTVDAVEVVWCKECKKNGKNGGDCNRMLSITSRDHVLELNVTEYIVLDFCSYGERKEK